MRIRLLLAIIMAVSLPAAACSSSGESLRDESFPTVEELQAAEDCDELNRLIAGVENESFRVNADRTLAEEAARAYDEYDTAFDIYYEAFSERQGDLGCSDAEMMSVLQTASDQRCQAWIDSGHSLDEDPLLLNTAQCSSDEISTATTTATVPTQTVTTEVAAQTVTTEVAADTVASEISDATDGSEAKSCGHVADVWIAITQEFINVFGAGPYEDWYGDTPSSELRAGSDVWIEKMTTLQESWIRLECDEFEGPFICERQPQLDALGPAGEAFIYDNTPCNLEGTFGPNSEAEARLNAWRDSQL